MVRNKLINTLLSLILRKMTQVARKVIVKVGKMTMLKVKYLMKISRKKRNFSAKIKTHLICSLKMIISIKFQKE